MASLAFPVAGAIAGSLVGQPALGWSIGSFIGSAVMGGEKGSDGPRLSDLNVQSSAYGADIPVIYSRGRVAGNVIWSTPKIEEKHSSGGKGGMGGGGGGGTTYTYSASFAVGLCEGEGVGILRIWADSKLIYKLDGTATLEEIFESNRQAQGFTIYTGSETQEADPTIQSFEGAANTQAYRGLMYIVFENFQLSDYGNRIPNFTFEVLTQGTGTEQGEILFVQNDDLDFTDYNRHITPIIRDGYLTIVSPYETGTKKTTPEPEDYPGGVARRFDSNLNYLAELPYSYPPGYNEDYDGNSPTVSRFQGYLGLQGVWVNSHVGAAYLLRVGNQSPIAGLNAVSTPVEGLPLLWGVACQATREKMLVFGRDQADSQDYIWMYDNNGALLFKSPVGYDLFANGWMEQNGLDNYYPICLQGGAFADNHMTLSEDGQYLWISRTAGIFGYHARFRIDETTGLSLVDTIISSIQDSAGSAGPLEWTSIEVGGVLYIFTSYFNIAVPSGFYTVEMAAVSPQELYNPGTITLDEIVSDICVRCGLQPAQIDVTELTDLVKGYTVAKVMTGRKAIEPLQTAFQFDAVEYAGKLNFLKRGRSVTYTIGEDDLGASTDLNPQQLVEYQRAQDSSMPSDVIVSYQDDDAAYQVGSQRAKVINYNTENVTNVELPIVFTADEGKQIAEIILQTAYTEREKFNFKLSSEYIDINPTDIVNLTADGYVKNVRVTKATHGSSIIDVEAVADDPRDYESDAEGSVGAGVDDTLTVIGPTDLNLLDIPLLRNADNIEGMYSVASGSSVSWPGAGIYKSSDNVSFNLNTIINSAATFGYTVPTASGILGDQPATHLDETSTVTVSVVNGTFSSVTYAVMQQGSNYVLIGSEVVQVQNVTDNGDGTVTFDTFIRGRRGTEWAVGEHTSSELVVLLDEDTLRFINADFNVTRYYKPVTFGQYLDEIDSQSFTNSCVNLKPFAPCRVTRTRDASNNLTINWVNRTRYVKFGFNTGTLYEDSEAYEIDVLDGADNVLRTIEVTDTTASYTAAEQTTDGLTPGDNVTIVIYQLSAIVGRGYGLRETI